MFDIHFHTEEVSEESFCVQLLVYETLDKMNKFKDR